MKKIIIAVNGYGVIGKRVADAVALQKEASKEEVLEAFGTSIRTAFIKMNDELSANTAIRALTGAETDPRKSIDRTDKQFARC